MQIKQNTGVDTRGMLPVLGGIFIAVSQTAAPWFSVPALKYTQMETSYAVWEWERCLLHIREGAQTAGTKMAGAVLAGSEIGELKVWGHIVQVLAVLAAVLVIGAVFAAYCRRGEAVQCVRLSFAAAMVPPLIAFGAVLRLNLLINEHMGRASDFVNLSIHSYVQLTAAPYTQFLLAGGLAAAAGYLLCTQEIQRALPHPGAREGRRIKTALVLNLTAIPMLILFGIFFLNNRSYTFISLCSVVLAMLPFCMVFENRRPQAREVLLIAVMASLAVAGRVAFFMIPQFKPVSAIVIITGVGLGAEAGFLTGAVAGFVSNFFFGQGPWTPWQMFAFGVIGFLAGILFRGKWEKSRRNRLLLCAYGGIATFVIYGLIMDTSSMTWLIGEFQWTALAGIYVSGLPFNAIHGVSTVVFLYFLAAPMVGKLARVRKKYGLIE